MMTKQEVFTKVVTHLRKQGCQARGGVLNRCMYRTDAGLMCAAGCLIPDEHYSPELEGKNTNHEAVREVLAASGVSSHAWALVGSLQDVHDWQSEERWESEFARIAKAYSLEVPPR